MPFQRSPGIDKAGRTKLPDNGRNWHFFSVENIVPVIKMIHMISPDKANEAEDRPATIEIIQQGYFTRSLGGFLSE
jgi:hypothetical protein